LAQARTRVKVWNVYAKQQPSLAGISGRMAVALI